MVRRKIKEEPEVIMDVINSDDWHCWVNEVAGLTHSCWKQNSEYSHSLWLVKWWLNIIHSSNKTGTNWSTHIRVAIHYLLNGKWILSISLPILPTLLPISCIIKIGWRVEHVFYFYLIILLILLQYCNLHAIINVY